MAITEACKFEVKEEIDRLVREEGISRNEASKKVAAWYSDILKAKIKPETIRKKDLRARDEFGTNVPNEDWPKCKNDNCRIGAHRLPVVSTTNGKPAKHGLCSICRSNERKEKKKEQIRTEFEAKKKEFERIPVDTESDKFWNELSDQTVSLLEVEGDIPCGKVSPETLSKINSCSKKFRHCLIRVRNNSECPCMASVD